jgi:hypothetical protein
MTEEYRTIARGMLAPGLGNMAHFRTRSEGRDRRANLTMVLQVIEGVERVGILSCHSIYEGGSAVRPCRQALTRRRIVRRTFERSHNLTSKFVLICYTQPRQEIDDQKQIQKGAEPANLCRLRVSEIGSLVLSPPPTTMMTFEIISPETRR